VSRNLTENLSPKYADITKIWDMRIGYARVSTEDHTMDLQKDAPKRARCHRNINFESLTERIETARLPGNWSFMCSPRSRRLNAILSGRTVAGLQAARARGRKGGGHARVSAKEIKTISALLTTADISISAIAARFGVARSTLYRSVVNHAAR
jgi:DNA invertase Pin-like site-specific DNA recombinase